MERLGRSPVDRREEAASPPASRHPDDEPCEEPPARTQGGRSASAGRTPWRHPRGACRTARRKRNSPAYARGMTEFDDLVRMRRRARTTTRRLGHRLRRQRCALMSRPRRRQRGDGRGRRPQPTASPSARPSSRRAARAVGRRSRVLRAGRSFRSEVTLSQGGVVCVGTHATFATSTCTASRALRGPAARASRPAVVRSGCPAGFASRPPSSTGSTCASTGDRRLGARSSGRDGEMRAWIGSPTDATLTRLVAVLPRRHAAGSRSRSAPSGGHRTIAFSGHVRSRPAPGWLRMRITTRKSSAACSRDATHLGLTRRVLAQSRQLAGVRMPETRRAWTAPPER